MALERGRLVVPRFDVWAPSGLLVNEVNLHDCVWINGSVRSVDLEFADPPMLIRSRFRVSRVLEAETRQEFEEHALTHFARHPAVELPADRPTSIDVVFDDRVLLAPLVLSTIVFASLNLDGLDAPHWAVDIALVTLPAEPLCLRRIDPARVASLFTKSIPPPRADW